MGWVLFSRRGCHLCEAAEDLVQELCPGADVVDVDCDPGVRQQYGLRVPVIEIDGVVAAEGRIERRDVERLAAGGRSDAEP
ncbi:MAG: glutaredoxin family protein [Planctomycetaceae bacterium]